MDLNDKINKQDLLIEELNKNIDYLIFEQVTASNALDTYSALNNPYFFAAKKTKIPQQPFLPFFCVFVKFCAFPGESFVGTFVARNLLLCRNGGTFVFAHFYSVLTRF